MIKGALSAGRNCRGICGTIDRKMGSIIDTKEWKRMKRLLALGLLLLVLFCGGSALADEIIPEKDLLIIPIGEIRTAKYSISPRGNVTFSSSDESIAVVRSSGKVKGLAEGECTITITSAKDPSVTADVKVQVVKPVKSLKASVASKEIPVGETMQVDYTLGPESATLKAVTFSSSKETVASVNAVGIITAHASGTANITVRSVDGEVGDTIKITVVQPPEEIAFKQPEYTVSVGSQLKFRVTVLPSNANNKRVEWLSSDESIATISKEGRLTAKSAGDVFVTAVSRGDPAVRSSVVVHCVIPIQKVTFEEELHDLRVGETVQLYPALSPENATRSALAYSSSNPYVCTVDENGLVTAVRGGEATITACFSENENRRDTVKIRVNVHVTGAVCNEKGMRIEVGTHAFGNVKLQPTDATNKNMTWTSTDETIASVTNTSNRPRIEAHKWGRVQLTGVTEDGGFEVSFSVNVGALHEAIVLKKAALSSGALVADISNLSDMHMTSVTLLIKGTDAQGSDVEETIVVPLDAAAGQLLEGVTVPMTARLKGVSAAVIAWETDTGYYTNSDQIKYTYRISGGLQEWCTAQ